MEQLNLLSAIVTDKKGSSVNDDQIGKFLYNSLVWTWTGISVNILNWTLEMSHRQYFNFKNEKKTEERNCYLRRVPKRDSNWLKILFSCRIHILILNSAEKSHWDDSYQDIPAIFLFFGLPFMAFSWKWPILSVIKRF